MGVGSTKNNKGEGLIQNYPSNINKRVNEVDTNHAASIPESVSDKLFNSICRIEVGDGRGTGFFLYIKEINGYFLFTNNHVIYQELADSKALIPIYYGKRDNEIKKIIKLDTEKRFIKCFVEPIDITAIEILKEDDIPESKFLFPDLNYKNGYSNYKKEDLYLSGYPNYKKYKNERHVSSGKINTFEEFEFEHTIDTREGSSGSPICLSSNLNVIGIHKCGVESKTINYGTFIGTILDELINNIKNKTNKKENNVKYYHTISSDIDFEEKIKKCVCSVEYEKVEFENCLSTGFFCVVPFTNRANLIPVLITINEEFPRTIDPKNELKIKISFNDHEFRELNLSKDRKIYITPNPIHGKLSIIELKPYDKITNFLELDESVLLGNNKKMDEYLNKIVSLFYYSYRRDFTSSLGTIKGIIEDSLYYTCKTTLGSSGAPVILKDSKKVIGIHFGAEFDEYMSRKRFNETEELKLGILITYDINDFMNGKSVYEG